MWVTKLLISPVKKRIFAQKRPNLAQNWHFWSIWCPVGESVGGCGARAVSRKTPIYFMIAVIIRRTNPPSSASSPPCPRTATCSFPENNFEIHIDVGNGS